MSIVVREGHQDVMKLFFFAWRGLHCWLDSLHWLVEASIECSWSNMIINRVPMLLPRGWAGMRPDVREVPSDPSRRA